MSQDLLNQRVTELRDQLTAEFAPTLSTDVVARCLQETVDAYRSVRIADFVPLFVHRETRTRLLRLAQAGMASA